MTSSWAVKATCRPLRWSEGEGIPGRGTAGQRDQGRAWPTSAWRGAHGRKRGRVGALGDSRAYKKSPQFDLV